METVVIVVREQGFDLEALERLLGDEFTKHQSELGQCLEVANQFSAVYICPMGGAMDGLFDGWPTALIPTEYTAFSMDYRDAALVESIIRKLSLHISMTVDTNFGAIVDGISFVKRIDDSRLEWKWWDWPAANGGNGLS